MGFFTKLFTGSGQSKASDEPQSNYPSENYKGFTITPQPLSDNGQYRVAGLIEKAQGEGLGTKKHQFIRSDVLANADQAAQLTLSKCKVFIDQLGDNIFD